MLIVLLIVAASVSLSRLGDVLEANLMDTAGQIEKQTLLIGEMTSGKTEEDPAEETEEMAEAPEEEPPPEEEQQEEQQEEEIITACPSLPALVVTPGKQSEFPDSVSFKGQNSGMDVITVAGLTAKGEPCDQVYTITANKETIYAHPTMGVGVGSHSLDSTKGQCLSYKFANIRESFDLKLHRASNKERLQITGRLNETELGQIIIEIDNSTHPNFTTWYGMSFAGSFDYLEFCTLPNKNGGKSDISIGQIHTRADLAGSVCYWDLAEWLRLPEDYNDGEAPNGYECPATGTAGVTTLVPLP